LHTTDTHGWHGGHLQEPQYNADWGDYISFATHLKTRATQNGADLLLIDTGDRVEGNGLYDGSTPPGLYTYDIFKNAPIDVMTVGNHELYINTTAQRDFNTTVPLYKSSYLASNLNITNPPIGAPPGTPTQPFAPRFKRFRTPNQNLNILAFGFLYNFGKPADNVRIQNVSDTVKEKWFLDALNSGPTNLILVAGHVQLKLETWGAGQEFRWILQAIRANVATSNTPVVFFGGHSHIRDFRKFDDKAYGLQSGRYGETVGFLSMSNLTNTGLTDADNSEDESRLANPVYQRRYIDANLFSYYSHARKTVATFDTPLGVEVTKNITTARAALQLDKPYGCAPADMSLYYAPYPSNQSILTWLETQVFLDTWSPLLTPPPGGRGTDCSGINGTGNPMLVMTNSGAIRFDVFKGRFTVDSVINMSPFTSSFRCLTAVPVAAARQLVTKLNLGPPILLLEDGSPDVEESGRLMEELRLSPPVPMGEAEESDLNDVGYADQVLFDDRMALQPGLLPGYVTKDDAGTDGDDTPHLPYPTYTVPNVVGATIALPSPTATVIDVVYNEFMEKVSRNSNTQQTWIVS
jgi:hypothetical protein